MLRKLKFNGEVVVVTGGGAGIGKATADALAQMGATVAIVGRTRETLESAAADLRARGGACEVFVADVSREDQVAALAAAVEGKWGRVKGLVNNAGTNFRTPLADLPSEKWREIMGANLDSVFFMCRAFIPLLLKSDKPSIVNVASSFGVIGNPQMPAYCASKGAVVNLTRQMAIDYGRKGLRVNSLCPGPTLSPRVSGYIEKGLTDPNALKAQVMLGRLAECEEIGDVAAFLVSDAASFMNGSTVVVDGGQTIN
ncbi:MAG: family oxidoreductase [Hyphomicrobiales bacterium]|nr:family oxidoreductase [Hyphomicrobiales bacterium]MDB5595028.1 family oxidoreductase [Hyphomicrobiales bacterium]